MAAIYRRELKGYFNTMIGYVIIVFLLAFSGIYFMAYNPAGFINNCLLFTLRFIFVQKYVVGKFCLEYVQQK